MTAAAILKSVKRP